MSETGATREQIERGCWRQFDEFEWKSVLPSSIKVNKQLSMEMYAGFLVPPSSRIIDDWPAFRDAVRRVMADADRYDFMSRSNEWEGEPNPDIALIEKVLGDG